MVNLDDMLSARQFAKETGLAINTVLKGIGRGAFLPQATVKTDRNTIYGFEEGYAKDVRKVLPTEKISGATLFTDDLQKALERINKKWLGRRVNW